MNSIRILDIKNVHSSKQPNSEKDICAAIAPKYSEYGHRYMMLYITMDIFIISQHTIITVAHASSMESSMLEKLSVNSWGNAG